MKLQRDSGWMRRGVTLLWDAATLSQVVSPMAVVSIRGFLAMRASWPEELPGVDGDALVVAGVEGCLDALEDEHAEEWLETDLRTAVRRFQDEYQGQAALILWLPSGRSRISMEPATEEYYWKTRSSKDTPGLSIGRCLWAGAESDVARIIVSEELSPDTDGKTYVGLYHPRVS